MALIGRLIGKLLTRGSITIIYPDGNARPTGRAAARR